MKKLIQSYWILLVLPSLTQFVLRIVFETTINALCKTTSENFPRQGPPDFSQYDHHVPPHHPPAPDWRSDQILSSCETSVGKSLHHLLQPHSAEKDEDAVARCLVASRGWGAEIVAFLSTHPDANTKFKFNFFQVLRLKYVTLISFS